MILILAARCSDESDAMTLGVDEGNAVPRPTNGPELALSGGELRG